MAAVLITAAATDIISPEQRRNFGRTAEAYGRRSSGDPAKLNEIDGDEWLDSNDPLTDDEKALLEDRLAAYEREPDAESSWEEIEARIPQLLRPR